jgi:hypothetical protein
MFEAQYDILDEPIRENSCTELPVDEFVKKVEAAKAKYLAEGGISEEMVIHIDYRLDHESDYDDGNCTLWSNFELVVKGKKLESQEDFDKRLKKWQTAEANRKKAKERALKARQDRKTKVENEERSLYERLRAKYGKEAK